MPDFMLQFVNQSKTTWSRYYFSQPTDDNSTVLYTPDTVLLANGSKQVLAWDVKDDESLGSRDESADGQVIWKASSGACFGVKIHVPIQMVGLGTRPYFQVKTEPNGSWNGEYSSQNDKFTFDKAVVGHDIYVDANSQPENMTLTVTIKDL